MPVFAANLSMLFKEYPFLERFAAARKAGFQNVEILFPYDISARDILVAMREAKLDLALINTPPPNWTGGDRGFAAIPGGEERFRHDFKRALRYADVLGAQMIHVMSGVADGPEAKETLIENLNWATQLAPKQHLTIEPINTTDIPGYFLNCFDLAADILDAVAAPNLALQFDAYHAHMITGDVLGTWAKHGHRAGHIQIAGAPGRHEPDNGDIDYPAFFRQIEADGYQGRVSAEYHPANGTAKGLGWLKAAQ
ncbi:hydroxypyruvate isomerase family protein [Shimia thalassica]|jgi:hydroxypyruvate isomerase|uniref:hydroxypyruvate isomerase family protein n=1 Tax=Shimia thalassica TaxID=1715693 RepID=UPI0026E34C34|nr:TIM barrel protein [Shimia thalassica]MDO6797542.1 TIM barrel protein [Shimia thalassica]